MVLLGLTISVFTSEAPRDWCDKQTRESILAVTCERQSDPFILSNQNGFIKLLGSNEGIPNVPLRRYVAWILFTKAALNYSEAAITLKALHQIDLDYDSYMSQSALAAFVALFPRPVSDEIIIRTANEAGWTPNEDSWKSAFWTADVDRTDSSGTRRTIRGLFGVLKANE